MDTQSAINVLTLKINGLKNSMSGEQLEIDAYEIAKGILEGTLQTQLKELEATKLELQVTKDALVSVQPVDIAVEQPI